jgi:hypothetical protein
MPFPRKSSKHSQQPLSTGSPTASTLAPAEGVSQGKGKAGAATSPNIPSSQPSFNKDARASEHERQRLRRAADFVKLRTKKAQQSAGLSSTKGHARSLSSSLTEKGTRLKEEEETFERDDPEGQALSDSLKENFGFVTVAMDPPSRYEVKLADLIRVGKPRKLKGTPFFPYLFVYSAY